MTLQPAVGARNVAGTQKAAIAVAHSGLDLLLRHRPLPEVKFERFDLWTRQILVDAKAGEAVAVLSDVATLEFMRDRIAHRLRGEKLDRLDAPLGELPTAAGDENLPAVIEAAGSLMNELT